MAWITIRLSSLFGNGIERCATCWYRCLNKTRQYDQHRVLYCCWSHSIGTAVDNGLQPYDDEVCWSMALVLDSKASHWIAWETKRSMHVTLTERDASPTLVRSTRSNSYIEFKYKNEMYKLASPPHHRTYVDLKWSSFILFLSVCLLKLNNKLAGGEKEKCWRKFSLLASLELIKPLKGIAHAYLIGVVSMAECVCQSDVSLSGTPRRKCMRRSITYARMECTRTLMTPLYEKTIVERD